MLIDTTTIKRIPAIRSIRLPDPNKVEEDVLELVDYILSLPEIKKLSYLDVATMLEEVKVTAVTYYSLLNK